MRHTREEKTLLKINNAVFCYYNNIYKGIIQEKSLTEPFLPGKLKKTSGPFRCGICRNTFNNFAE